MMKKLLALCLSLGIFLGLAACGSTPAADTQPPEHSESAVAPTPSATQPNQGAGATETDSQSSQTLVVSFSATGNTEEAANLIAEATGADVFRLEPVTPYTDEDLDWTDDNSRVVYEHDNPD